MKSSGYNSKKGKQSSGSPKPTVVSTALKKNAVASTSSSSKEHKKRNKMPKSDNLHTDYYVQRPEYDDFYTDYTMNTVTSSSSKEYKKRNRSPESVGLFDEMIKRENKKKKKSFRRKVVSLSIVAYLTYSVFYSCGSPFDQSTEKPCICSAIDPIKLDIYSLYQSNYYKTKVDPYVAPAVNKAIEAYHDYGLPVQIRLNEFYLQTAKPKVIRSSDDAHKLYLRHIKPFYLQKVAPVVNPYIDQARPYVNQVLVYYENQVQPLYHQATNKAIQAQSFIQDKYGNLPPSVKQLRDQLKDQIMYWIDRAENTDMRPILLKVYWSVVDFYQLEFLPVFNSSHVVTQIKVYYNENAKPYVDQNVKPFLIQVNNKVHVDQLISFILSCLPERPIIKEEQIYAAKTTSTQVKTSSSVAIPKTQHVPITPPAVASVKTVTISSKSISTESPAPASTTVAPTLDTITSDEKPEATIGKYFESDDDIIKAHSTSIRPSSTPIMKPDPNAAPDAEKKEAIYCPTCNAEEEQLIIANTDKNIIPIRTDKHVIAVPTDNELFEVHKEDTDIPPTQPTSPNEDVFDDEDQIVIQAPIPKKKETPSVKEEDIVFSIQTEIPTASQNEEDIVFSIQTEVPTESEEEDTVFSIQTETPISEEDIIVPVEDKLEEERIEEVDQKIVEEIRHEAKKQEEFKKEEQIFIPPAIEKEELVLESNKEGKKSSDEPVFVKVEEPEVVEQKKEIHYEEPIVKVVEEPEEPIIVVEADKDSSFEPKADNEFVVAQKPFAGKPEDPAIKIKAPVAKEQVEKTVPVEQ